MHVIVVNTLFLSVAFDHQSSPIGLGLEGPFAANHMILLHSVWSELPSVLFWDQHSCAGADLKAKDFIVP